MKIFFVVNVDWFFVSHRLPIAIEAIRLGHDVTLISKDTGKKSVIEQIGIQFIELPFERTKVNLLNEIKLYFKLRSIYKHYQPDIVHHVTLKPIILGTLAAKVNKKIGIVNAVSGLGVMFSGSAGMIRRNLTLMLMQWVFRLENKMQIIFQNPVDRDIFLKHKLVDAKHTCLIKGSGVDLKEFHFHPPLKKENRLVFMAARLLYPKGFEEFSLAAEYIKLTGKYTDVQFHIAGDLDPNNPTAISESTIIDWEKKRGIHWLGMVTNMKEAIAKADVIVYPSYYGEGVPKFLIECCAIGRPIITTQQPGCSDCVDDEVNGFLIDSRDYLKLAKKIMLLLDQPHLRLEFGNKSRIKAEQEFAIEKVIDKTIEVYNILHPK